MRLPKVLAAILPLSPIFVAMLVAPLVFYPHLFAATPGKDGEITCVSCHQAQASQPGTPMGRAIEPMGSNSVLAARPKLSFRGGVYSYFVESRNGQSEYRVSDGSRTISVPILWAFGSQAQTWVLKRDGKLYESLVSYYPSIDGLDITTGDEPLKPASLEEAVGRPISDQEARACFGCHATNAVHDGKLELAALKPGVACEHCHAGTADHLAGFLRGEMSAVPPKLGGLSSEDMANFCGKCHRSWETAVRAHWHGEADVRFQPYRLANSKCFDGADARISCVACHDPHKNIVRDPAFYDAKCLACHAANAARGSSGMAHGKLCPVAKSHCSTCHMPKVALPNGLLRFSDHDIRIVRGGEPYPF